MDVPDAQMRRLGRWDHSRMTQHYSTGLPRQGARMLAGHGPEPGKSLFRFIHLVTYRIGNYYLERECLSPTDELQKLIFPLIEATDATNEKNGPDLQDIAQRSFMELLRWFRVIILQDAVFLRDKFSSSPLWNHDIFKHPLFEEFATRLKVEARHGDEPRMVSISRVIPHVAHVLQEQYRAVQTTLNIHHQSNEIRFSNIDSKIQQSINEVEPLRQLLAALNDKGLEVRTHIRVSEMGEGAAAVTQPFQLTSATDRSVPATADQSIIVPSVPQYRMQPWVQTVVQLWEEYDRGIAPAVGQPRGPSIRVLDEKHGSAWRRLPVDKKAYSRRRHIWLEIIAASKDLGIPPEQVAEKMDCWRSEGRKSSISLKKLDDMLSAVGKSREPPLWGPNRVELLRYV